VTDAQGRFLFECLESGQYLLEATKEGFQGARAMFAAPDSDAVIRMQPVSALTPVGSGAVLSARQMQIPEKARKLFDKGIEELYQNKKPEASLDYFRQAIDLHRDFDEAYVQMGTAYFRLARATDAEQTFRKAIEVYPKNGRAHMYLAELLSSQGKIGPAVEELGKAIENEDTLWQAHLDLARILAKQGKAKEALVHAARAHELNKASPEVHLTYYNACISTRDLAAALAELDEIGKLFPESDTAKKLLAIRPKLAADVAAKKP
jgi:tetratricopeptide (TPR) repeat protein